jgi:hypothetical protein
MKYIVRANNYNYNDENYFIECAGDITGIYENKQEAIAIRDRLNIKAIREISELRDFIWNAENAEEKSIWLNDFFIKNFRITLFESEPEIEDEVHIPKTATDEQVLLMLKNLDIRFYEVYEFDSEPQMVELQYNPEFWGKQDYDPFTGEYGRSFYFSEEEAINYLKAKIETAFYETTPGVTGNLAQLSNSPDILSDLLKKSTSLTYDSVANKIAFIKYHYEVPLTELKALIEILKVKPYTVVQFSLKDAQKYTGKPNYSFTDSQKAFVNTKPNDSTKQWWQFWK